MSDMMTFPATVEEFMEQYKIVDDEKVYTNGADLVPIFRMMQWFEHVSATDTISRQAAIMDAESWVAVDEYEKHLQKKVVEWLKEFPPAQLGTNLAEVGTRKVRGYPIDADALMEKVEEEYGDRARNWLYQIIRYMPPAQPKQRTGQWIPVKDKEPNLYKRVIVTWEYGGKRYTAEASRQERNGTTFYKAESPDLFRYNPLKVVAWQEKPEPWEGDAE